jgi:hypothetical protein
MLLNSMLSILMTRKLPPEGVSQEKGCEVNTTGRLMDHGLNISDVRVLH